MSSLRFDDGTPYPCVICARTLVECDSNPTVCFATISDEEIQRAIEKINTRGTDNG